jgi:hypothetical protein
MKVETLLLAFFNSRESAIEGFEITSKWGKQLNYDADRSYLETSIQLSDKYGVAFEQSGKTLLVAKISNPNNIT